ncbi:MAG: tetratricopeptide repeat protein [Pseudomonadota bacterium]
MSLLMQALKKAERAKQNSLYDEEAPGKPSEAFDDVLALTPQDVLQGRVPPAPLSSQLSLEPMDLQNPAPARPDIVASLEQIPALLPAEEAIHDPTPPQSRIEPAAPSPAPTAGPTPPMSIDEPKMPTSVFDAQPIDPDAIARRLDHGPAAPVDIDPNHARHAAQRGAGRPAASAPGNAAPASGQAASAQTQATLGAAARIRAAAAARAGAAEDKVGWDPARIRLAILTGTLALIVALFGYLYWRAVSAPGPGASLPMVPMPPPNAAGPAPAMVVTAPAGTLPGTTSMPTQDADPHAANGAQTGAVQTPALSAAGVQPAPASRPATAPATAPRRPSEDDIQFALQQAAGQNAPAAPAQQASRQAMPPPAPAGAQQRRIERAASASSEGDDIKVTRNSVAPRISPALQGGYDAFVAGDLSGAARQYASALRQDPNNRDALLGAAAVAMRQNNGAQAAASYLRLLELNPADADAQAGLLGLRPGDIGQSELRLQDLLRKSPDSGPLLFALGNLYSRQNRWPEAQQLFFRAYTASPDNPDYAFNLAVGLDRLNQGKLALGYYQRALALAQSVPAGFDADAVRLRMQELGGGQR